MVVVLIELAISGVLLTWLIVKKGSLSTDVAILLTLGVVFGHAFLSIEAGALPLTFPRLWTGWILCRWLSDYLRGNVTLSRWGLTEIGLYGFLVFVAIQLSQTHWEFLQKKPLAYFLFFLLLPAAVYFVTSNSRFDAKALKLFRGAFVIFGGYLAVTAFCETIGPSALVFPSYIKSPKYEEFLGRARGPYLNPVANGIAMTMALASAASFWPKSHRLLKPLILAYLGMVFCGVILTYTRSCWAGAVLGLGSMILFQLAPRYRIAAICIGLVIAVPTALEVKRISSSFKRDKHVTVEQMEESATLRPLLAVAAWEMFVHHPWTGVGYGQYLDHNRRYIESADTQLPLQKISPYVQHNSVLALLVETGILGTSLFAMFALGSTLAAIQLGFRTSVDWELRCIAWIQLAMLASLAFNSAWHDVLVEDGNFQAWAALAGLTMGVQRQTSHASVPSKSLVAAANYAQDSMPAAA